LQDRHRHRLLLRGERVTLPEKLNRRTERAFIRQAFVGQLGSDRAGLEDDRAGLCGVVNDDVGYLDVQLGTAGIGNTM
jgi:hypothetical protein